MREAREVPRRRSLVVRLFVLVAVVAVVSIVATAWLTVRTTAVGIHEEQGQALAADAEIADALTGYAATHHDWAGARTLVRRLARTTGHRVTLTDSEGTAYVDSSTGGAPLPARQSAAIDVLDVGSSAPAAPATADPACRAGTQTCAAAPASFLGPVPGDAPIDPRAVGPFALTDQERSDSRALAERVTSCLDDRGDLGATVSVSPTGRASVAVPPQVLAVPTACTTTVLETPMPSEVAPLSRLQRLVDRCLARRHGPAVALNPDLAWTQRSPRVPRTDAVVESCLVGARRAQLASYVAPAARLYVSSTRQEATTFLDLSAHNRLRILEVALAVLLGSLGFAAVAGRQLVRPLGTLATAARRVREGDLSARADVRARDEIGSVAAAFNTMAERRERAEVLRKAMVGDVAHELRNPLSTIRGSLEAAQDGLVAIDAVLVASLLEETVLLQHVVEDLQDLAAADAGELRLNLADVAVPELLAQVVAAHRGDADAAGVDLAATSAPGLVAHADALRLRQLLGNLVGNAVRHTPAGGSVRLTGSTVDASTAVAVTDTGEGIALDDLPHVFERFWRADPSRARASGGSGLGLAIVRQLAEAHGGSVSVTSEVGVGSSFEVRLPAALSRGEPGGG